MLNFTTVITVGLGANSGQDRMKIFLSRIDPIASEVLPFTAFVNPDHQVFMTPGDPPEKIRTFCENTGQPVLQGKGEIIRTELKALLLTIAQIRDANLL